MRIKYINKSVEQYCETYKASMRYFKDDKVVKKLALLITDLKAFHSIVDFANVPKLKKYRLHDLQGNKKGIKSLSVDYTWRMELTVEFYTETIDGEDEITVLGVSKHYEK